MTDGFDMDDFMHTAKLLKSGDDAVVSATLSNNLNIIIAALYEACEYRVARNLLQALEDHCQVKNTTGPAEHADEGKTIRASIQAFLAKTAIPAGNNPEKSHQELRA